MNEDYEELMMYIKQFGRVEDIDHILIIGKNEGIRRIDL